MAIMDGRCLLHFSTLIWLLVRFTSCSVVFGNMDTFLTLPTLVHQSFYVLQEDVYQPGSIIAALENAVVSISPDGVMTEISGSPEEKGYQEGEQPLFSTIQGIYQLNETSLIVSDNGNDCLRNVNKQTGSTTAYTGQCGSSSYADGSLDEAGFSKPTDIEKFGQSGKILVVEYNAGRLRTVDVEAGVVTTSFDASIKLTHFLYALSNEFYIISRTAILRIEDGTATTYSGSEDEAGFIDANRAESRYQDLQGVAGLLPDVLIVADEGNQRLRVIPRDGNVQSICSGETGHTNGDTTSCELRQPYSVMVMNGKLYIGESGYLGGGIRTLPFTAEGNCPVPPGIENGFYNPQDFGYSPGDLVTYYCQDGYERVGTNYQLTCANNTEWQGELPTCRELRCDAPPSIEFANYSPIRPSYSVSESIQYTCGEGYELVGTAGALICNSDRSWDGITPVCSEKLCGQPPLLQHGTYYPSQEQYSIGDVVQYTCNQGYELEETELANLTCQQDKSWGDTLPTCTELRCDAPPSVEFANYSPIRPSYSVSESIQYTCGEGYELVGTAGALICNSDRSWDGITPACSEKLCGQPPSLQHGTYYPSQEQYVVGDVVQYTCSQGYELEETELANQTCQLDQSWGDRLPTCIELGCGQPNTVPHSMYEPSQTWFSPGDVIQFTCDSGYRLQMREEDVLTCSPDGAWTGPLPRCTLVTCEPPRDVDHASYYPTKTEYHINETVQYSCSTGYELEDPVTSQIYCNRDGNWQRTLPVCAERTCDSPPEVLNASSHPTKTEYRRSDTVLYICSDGYELVDAEINSMSCGADGFWDGITPLCLPDATSDTTSPSAAVIGGSVGGSAILISAVLIILYLRRRKTRRNRIPDPNDPPPAYSHPISLPMQPPANPPPPPPNVPVYSYDDPVKVVDDQYMVPMAGYAAENHCYELDEEDISRNERGSVILKRVSSNVYAEPNDVETQLYVPMCMTKVEPPAGEPNKLAEGDTCV